MNKQNNNKEPNKPHKQYDRVLRNIFGNIAEPILGRLFGLQIESIVQMPEKLLIIEERETDFSILAKTATNDKHLIHFEFQLKDSNEIRLRLPVYQSILHYKYKLPVWQFVLYLGKRNPKYLLQEYRYTVIDAANGKERVTEFMPYTVIHLKGIDYQTFLQSDKWQMVALTVLCNFGKKSAETVSQEIVQRLINLAVSDEELDDSLLNLRILSQAHNLQALIIKTINKMKATKIFDIRRDPLFNEGHEIGVLQGKQEGKLEGKLEGEKYSKVKTALKMLKANKDISEIIEFTELTEFEMKMVKAYFERFGLDAINHLNITDKEITVK